MPDRDRFASMADLDDPGNAHLAPAAYARCELCDDEGYRLPARRVICDHKRREHVGQAQRAHIWKMLAKGKK